MKKLFFFLSFCLFHFISQAQAPQGIPYQSVVRNGSGALISNQPVSMRFSIHDSTMQGNIVYQETHNTTTSNGGMVILNIGLGTPVTGTFSAINWGVNAKYMQVELDTTATGNNYVDLGTQQLMSVPYALYAGKATNSDNGLPQGGAQGKVIAWCEGEAVWTINGKCPAKISSLNCANSITPNLFANVITNTILNLPYTGGNGGSYEAQSITSSGVSGLTLNIQAGTLTSGNGSLPYLLSGTPASTGIATFILSIAGQSCTLNFTINPTPNISCNNPDVFNPNKTYGSVTDIDGNAYKTIQIGTQEWMAENLRTGHYRNGDAIEIVRNGVNWLGLNTGASCWYNDYNSPSFSNDSITNNCLYGRLYNWFAVADSRNVCPLGWHVPSPFEWNVMVKYLDPSVDTNLMYYQNFSGNNIGSILRSTSAIWPYMGTNNSGFSALPGGARFISLSDDAVAPFQDKPIFFYCWSSYSDYNYSRAFQIIYYGSGVRYINLNQRLGASIRCVKD